MKGIIPTGGRGTRMRPITFSANKHFLPVGNKPLIFYPVETVAGTGIKDIAITYNPGGLELCQKILGDGSKWSVKFTYVLQPEPKGLANIVEVCEEYLDGETFLFHLGDNIFTGGLKGFVEDFRRRKPDGMISVIHHPHNDRMGVPYYDKKGKLFRLVEKPKSPPNDLAIAGAYIANNRFLKMFKGKDGLQPSARGEYEMPDAFQWMIDRDYRVEAYSIQDKWLDPGKFDDWLEANRYLLDKFTPESTNSVNFPETQIEGRVIIGKNCRISHSQIRGPVNIADNVIITNSFVGPYSSIYQNCHIDSCQLENSILMDSTSLDHVAKPIDTSIFGPHSDVIGNNHLFAQFFVGELSQIKL